MTCRLSGSVVAKWQSAMSNPITASPLTWPTGWPRETQQVDSRFGSWNKKPTINDAVCLVLDELRIMGIDGEDVIISTDLKLRLDGLPYSSQRQPDDSGSAVYWRDLDGNDRVIALDKYNRIGCNIWAIGKTLENLRGIERWGGGQILERAFTGFTALPSPEAAGGGDPYELLGISPDDDNYAKLKLYRKALSKHHPDKGGDSDTFNAVRKAGIQLGIVGVTL